MTGENGREIYGKGSLKGKPRFYLDRSFRPIGLNSAMLTIHRKKGLFLLWSEDPLCGQVRAIGQALPDSRAAFPQIPDIASIYGDVFILGLVGPQHRWHSRPYYLSFLQGFRKSRIWTRIFRWNRRLTLLAESYLILPNLTYY